MCCRNTRGWSRATALVEALERLWTRLGPREPQKVQTDSDP